MEGKRTKGRQKIEMKRIENDDDRLCTFSKRRSGIYKKASEMVTLCGAEVGVLVFSPAGKPFSFAHPSLESVTNRVLDQNTNPPQGDNAQALIEAHRQIRINELNQQYNELVSQLEAEKEQGKALQKLTKARGGRGWWEAPIEELGVEELQKMHTTMEELRNDLCNCMIEKGAAAAGASSSSLFAGNSAQVTNQFGTNNASGTDPSASHFGYGYGNRIC